jgi:hypothetical protein
MSLEMVISSPLLSAAVVIAALVIVYLARLNQVLSGTPEDVGKLSPIRWSAPLLRETYRRLEADPITTNSYAQRIPPKLERRYIVTGGSGKCFIDPPATPDDPDQKKIRPLCCSQASASKS